VPMATLYHIAAADGFHGLGLSRRDAAWAIKGLRDEALPLFAAVDDRAGLLRPEALEPSVTLAPMSQGRQVVEDYRSTGLSGQGGLYDRVAAVFERNPGRYCTGRPRDRHFR
jgi:error-prone DNA polymerase